MRAQDQLCRLRGRGVLSTPLSLSAERSNGPRQWSGKLSSLRRAYSLGQGFDSQVGTGSEQYVELMLINLKRCEDYLTADTASVATNVANLAESVKNLRSELISALGVLDSFGQNRKFR